MTRFVAIGRTAYHTCAMRTITALLALGAALLLAAPALALDRGQTLGELPVHYPAAPEHETTQAGCMTLSQATAAVRRRTGGKIVSAETRIQGGREIHYIRVMKDGRVWTEKVSGCGR